MGHRTVRNRAGRLTGFVLATLLLVLPASLSAYSFYAHTITADIAEANVRADTRAKMQRLFAYAERLGTPECRLQTIQDASVWPDCVRRTGWRWGYTAAWHYRAASICETYNPRANCAGGSCVTAQIERNHRLLADESLPPHLRLEALAFLVHFVGDVHMPLHAGDKGDRGGNDRKADYGIAPGLSLHSIWDGPLAERAISSARPGLVRRYSAAERADLAGGNPTEWGRESWQLARDFVYPTAFDQSACETELPGATALSQSDIEAAIPIQQRRVQQAGLRIARLLDEAFAPGPLADIAR